jgi:hypothetical protein
MSILRLFIIVLFALLSLSTIYSAAYAQSNSGRSYCQGMLKGCMQQCDKKIRPRRAMRCKNQCQQQFQQCSQRTSQNPTPHKNRETVA